jgi:hypothetical protein
MRRPHAEARRARRNASGFIRGRGASCGQRPHAEAQRARSPRRWPPRIHSQSHAALQRAPFPSICVYRRPYAVQTRAPARNMPIHLRSSASICGSNAFRDHPCPSVFIRGSIHRNGATGAQRRFIASHSSACICVHLRFQPALQRPPSPSICLHPCPSVFICGKNPRSSAQHAHPSALICVHPCSSAVPLFRALASSSPPHPAPYLRAPTATSCSAPPSLPSCS